MASLSHRRSAEAATETAGPSRLVNRLSESRSPYVRGHMNNPVAWQLWDSAAINLAKRLNRLIFLSIGYSACHWCHVMEKESFMSPEVAAILNKSFVPIKLDREERPDIDEVYMNYVQAITGSGGWPLNVFLTPDLEPVFGGTYWPGPYSSSMPRVGGEEPITFIDILEKLRDVWNSQQLRCMEKPKLLEAVYDIIAYITSPPILSPEGAFHSSEDADSFPNSNDTEKREGAFYVWTLKEMQQILGQRDAEVCAHHWGVLPDGNVARGNDPHDEFINQNVLCIRASPRKIAKDFGLSEDEVVRVIKSSRKKLQEFRDEHRVRPDLDDKIIVSWNGLAIGALAKCSLLLDKIDAERATHCRRVAEKAAKFIRENLFDAETGQLWRVYRDGRRGETPGFGDDYAYLASGLISLYEATFDDSYLQFAENLQRR
ncbi:hypothetical protein CISG_07973 [Coccidioides immitis RMSCC 3703]|uniref:Spermatogenesis-associated protein 20-like TRX domain-containing protein n=1 Tax=Coccidioides immitis RMSCC 3703 TaxID=454286 RepID=A0A0J8R8F3_COCIT|nr:hypothetical protein CISG_07973 [Coccidioides immitis RMSCC 3703]